MTDILRDFLERYRVVANQHYQAAGLTLDQPLPDVKKAQQVAMGQWIALDTVTAEQIEQSAVKPACRSGCYWCCSIVAAVLPHEAIFIALCLQSPDSPVDLTHIEAELIKFDDKTKNTGYEKRWRHAPLCPFLENGTCSIYPIRPLACRGHFSANANRCKKDYRARKSTGDSSETVPFLFGPKLIAGLSHLGVQAAFEQRGLESHLVELVGAVRIALETPDIVSRYFSGERLFENVYYNNSEDTLSREAIVMERQLKKLVAHEA